MCVSSAGTAQKSTLAESGSRTAKAGFRNETEIAVKFENWRTDPDARLWLSAMGYRIDEIESVKASKPHGEKADVQVRVRARSAERVEGVSIKLVSNTNGFNQVDKRWLSHYAKLWKMPAEVVEGLKLFVGEMKPNKPSRNPKRMFLNELDASARDAIVDFFTRNKDAIVSDLLAGDGAFAAEWLLVAFRPADKTRWAINSSADAARFFGEGKVEITRAGLDDGRV